MRNILGEDGVINLDGKLGSDSLILDINDPCFYECIEDGIKSTVKALIDNGFKTYSSCQGHHSLNHSYRNVVVILKENEIDSWKAMISEINIINSLNPPITYVIVDYKNDFKGLMILLGSIYDINSTEKNQKYFEEAIPTIRSVYYSREYHNIVDFSNSCGHINTFTDCT